MLPLARKETLVGRLNPSSEVSLPGLPPCCPRTIRILPSGLILNTAWPSTSTHQRLPSGPTRMPCDDFTPRLSAGHDWSRWPVLSNCITGQWPRLKTQTLPLRSTSTPETSPKFMPFGMAGHVGTTLRASGVPVFSLAAASAGRLSVGPPGGRTTWACRSRGKASAARRFIPGTISDPRERRSVPGVAGHDGPGRDRPRNLRQVGGAEHVGNPVGERMRVLLGRDEAAPAGESVREVEARDALVEGGGAQRGDGHLVARGDRDRDRPRQSFDESEDVGDALAEERASENQAG